MSKPISFYFGYGSNLSKEQMSLRCPDCEYFISGKLPHYEWLINQRGYASIKPSKEAFVLGEVFKLSNKDIEHLDIYENVSEGFYRKHYLNILTEEGVIKCLVYIASDNNNGVAQSEYIDRINDGINSASLPLDYVENWIRPFIPEN